MIEQWMEDHLNESIDDRDRDIRQALEALDDAEREIDFIRTGLLEAAKGHPYKRVGTVNGVSAGKIFKAFGSIEHVAALEKAIKAAAEEEPADDVPMAQPTIEDLKESK